MGTVLPFAEHKPFDPKVAEAMGVAFDTAWQKLLASGSTLASPSSADKTREALAMYIIDVAQRGEHDVNRLCDDAIAFVQDAVHLKQA
jgi:hypothetical protein